MKDFFEKDDFEKIWQMTKCPACKELSSTNSVSLGLIVGNCVYGTITPDSWLSKTHKPSTNVDKKMLETEFSTLFLAFLSAFVDC